ncbi:hypothetical protein F5878DRAFT_530933 [Lentinula raphanica]|uniref:Protein kinase domain-containing protein n=1 Tax=Lentinula raphanica TaxID=153919 RepID=A0AA38UHC8_9AGAR|nr:hypothetical protein F5878DRAFT_530933 [Lentinula raphanica]
MKNNKSPEKAATLPLHTADIQHSLIQLFELIHRSHTLSFSNEDGVERAVHFGRVIFRSHNTIGRGTMVIEVQCACRSCGNGCDWKEKNLVMKLRFTSKTRASELNFLEEMEAIAKEHSMHRWVLNHLPKIYCSFYLHLRDDSPQPNLERQFRDVYEMRVVRGTIQERLEPLTSLETAKECAQVFYDVLQCHHWVWQHPKILHRDISQGNIMVRVKDGRKYGVLNDWDLASWADDLQKVATSRYRTGTRPSMAHEQQAHRWEGPHQYRHDLEALFYVMVLFTFLYSKPGKAVSKPVDEQFHYEKWHQFDDGTLYSKKCMIMALNSPWEPPVTSFFIHFSDWLYDIKGCFCWGFNEQGIVMQTKRDAEQRGIQSRTQNVLSYKDDELGGHITYKKMVQIMHRFNEQELHTYDGEAEQYLESQEIDSESD